MAHLTFNGVAHVALSLAKEADDNPLFVQPDVFVLLSKEIIPFLLTKYQGRPLFSGKEIPSFREEDKLTKMAAWTSHARTGVENVSRELVHFAGAMKIIIGSGMWSVIHFLAMIMKKNPESDLIRRTFIFVCRMSVEWIRCPDCSQHWKTAIENIDKTSGKTKRTIEQIRPDEAFEWTVGIHTIASSGENKLNASLDIVETQYLLWYKEWLFNSRGLER